MQKAEEVSDALRSKAEVKALCVVRYFVVGRVAADYDAEMVEPCLSSMPSSLHKLPISLSNSKTRRWLLGGKILSK